MQKRFLTAALALAFLGMLRSAASADSTLEEGFRQPPNSARLHAYWWWLNGNVTKAAITRDLEEMKAKGFGGAIIIDAGGAEQMGNDRVPHGPTFFSPEWRELYKHALREADRLGLEMSLNIQSGWNLGGPMVKAEDAAKKLTWSELQISDSASATHVLPKPKFRDDYYRDIFVVAYRFKQENPGVADRNPMTLAASSEQSEHPARDAADGDANTFWVSAGVAANQGPSLQHPEWLQMSFARAISANRLMIRGRPGHTLRAGELQVSDNGQDFRRVTTFAAAKNNETLINFPAVTGRVFRISVSDVEDQGSPKGSRNTQIVEVALSGSAGAWPASALPKRPIQNWAEKAMYRTLHSSTPDTSALFQEIPAEPGEEETHATEVLDLTTNLDAQGVLHWTAPAGQWMVLRFGTTIGDNSRVSTCSEGWEGFALDVLDADAFRHYWDAVVEPLISDAGPLAGKSLKYLHTDSWEVEAINWTPTLRGEFRQRRGYDLLSFAPVLAGHIVNSRLESDRFLHDFRKTLGDLAVDNHFRLMSEAAHRHGLLIHPESGGPHGVPIDAQRCLGVDDAPMSEFWAWSWEHRIGDENRFFVKQPASAAHTYGHPLVLAEGFTTIGPHWQERIPDNLKPTFDKACCEGLNLMVWHAFVCSPVEMGIPGQQYFAGTHFNPNTTWWEKSGAFLSYIDRCQFLLQQGKFVADVCYYYGDHVPNFTQLKSSDPARIEPGYDYDVVTEENILTRLSVRDGRLVMPDGMNYRVMVLPNRKMISAPVLRKLKEFVTAGATIIGPKPAEASTLLNFPACDTEVAALGNEIWGDCNGTTVKSHRLGKGRVVWGEGSRQVLEADGIKQDFEFTGAQPGAAMDYIHRQTDDAEIYFVANRSNRTENLDCQFRVTGKAPELWDAVTGEHHFVSAYEEKSGRTTVPLQFEPFRSWFIVFRAPAVQHSATASSNTLKWELAQELVGPWNVKFDTKWGGPESAQFDQLTSWTTREEPGIRFYSGTATYVKNFDLAGQKQGGKLWLDLGDVRELAEVKLNGKSLGVIWTTPFRVDITDTVRPSGNLLEIEVVNFWPNRIIGDASLPVEKRLTRTNIRKLTEATPLMTSGLLGPVRILASD